jgi:hypothetical protein
MKQNKSQWLQDPVQINGDNINIVSRESRRCFREIGKNILKTELTSLQHPVRTKIFENYIEA